jgi:hypothetical protein
MIKTFLLSLKIDKKYFSRTVIKGAENLHADEISPAKKIQPSGVRKTRPKKTSFFGFQRTPEHSLSAFGVARAKANPAGDAGGERKIAARLKTPPTW